jgi:hypothetical protein
VFLAFSGFIGLSELLTTHFALFAMNYDKKLTKQMTLSDTYFVYPDFYKYDGQFEVAWACIHIFFLNSLMFFISG